MFLQPNDHVLFYGDSITDCGRRQDNNNNGGMGVGYASLCGAFLSARHPEMNWTFSNTGISGNRVYDLESRLDNDALALKPTVVSILIGINDTWRFFDRGVKSPVDEFVASYERIARRLQESGARLLLLEPFLLPVPDDRRAWREDLDPRIHAIRDLAVNVGALYLPLDGLFAQAACQREAAFWLPDGVHPSPAGHALIAGAWMDAVVRW